MHNLYGFWKFAFPGTEYINTENNQLWKQIFRNLATLGTKQISFSLEQLLDSTHVMLLRKLTYDKIVETVK